MIKQWIWLCFLIAALCHSTATPILGQDMEPTPATVEGEAEVPSSEVGGEAMETSDVEFLELPGEKDSLTAELYPEEPEREDVGGADESNLISITLDDVEMVDVVRMFTRISGANIIAAPSNLVGRVTVNLTEVEWQPALESILDMHGLALVEKTPGSRVYSITRRQAGAPEPMRVETFFLSYATVDTVEPVVKTVLVPSGTISKFASQNALVVKSTANNLGEIRQLVLDLDQLREQVFLEAKFMELNDEARRDIGVDWGILQAYGISANNLAWSKSETKTWSDSRIDGISRNDNRSNVDRIDERYDLDNEQYEESTTTFLESPPDSGNYLSETRITPTRTITDTIGTGQSIGSSISSEFGKSIEEVRTALLGADDFRIILSALKQLNGVTVISNPKIIVANNETATIHIGEKEPNIRGTVTAGQQGQANTTTYSLDVDEPYFNFGISVDVTPTVNTASNITVDITPKLTRFLRDKLAPDGTTYPVTTTKEIKTVFAMESGKTAAIGGLTETQQRDVEKKVPLLGDIPLIGKYLFSHESSQMVQQETIIFVTVELAMPDSIQRETGLPEDTELVRKRLIRSKVERAAFEADLQELREATDDKALETTSKSKARLLKRRE